MLATMQYLTGYLRARFIRSERGQGSVEYLGIVLVVGAIMLALIGLAGAFDDDGILNAITDGIEDAINSLTD
jgi:Flp pilus assembly pilin Flp